MTAEVFLAIVPEPAQKIKSCSADEIDYGNFDLRQYRPMQREPTIPAELPADLAGYLETLQQYGMQWLPKSNPASSHLGRTQQPLGQHRPPQATTGQDLVAEDGVGQDLVGQSLQGENTESEATDMVKESPATWTGASAALQALRSEVAGCTKCPDLAASRTQTVFGVGNPRPRLCFVGEAPGADEDKQGEPFVGRAGQLLNKIFEACGLARDDVYILNTIKCRPPGNRNPNEQEIENCWGYAIRQIELLQPEFLCCLGGVATATLLDTKRPIGELRGKMHDFRGIPVMVTYHPAYLLRNPGAKNKVWEDMKFLMREMGTPIE